jgi:hypothetical protein
MLDLLFHGGYYELFLGGLMLELALFSVEEVFLVL